MLGSLEITIDDFDRDVSMDVSISYLATPGEPMVRYCRDGSGCPGYGPAAEMLSVAVKRYRYREKQKERCDHWIWNKIDKAAESHVLENWHRFEDRCLEDAAMGSCYE